MLFVQVEVEPISECLKLKVNPPHFDLEEALELDVMSIDDETCLVRLKHSSIGKSLDVLN